MNIRHHEVWNFEYNGVNGEVIKTLRLFDNRDAWCHYIYIPIESVPESFKHLIDLPVKENQSEIIKTWQSARWTPWDYTNSFLSRLKWHGGITFYEKRGGVDGVPLVIKAGCDYSHSCDMFERYNLEYIIAECKETIDSLLEEIPLYIRCRYNGKYYPRNIMKPYYDGYISPEGEQADKEYKEKYGKQ